MPKTSGFSSPEEAAMAMRDMTRALPDINQVPDSGRCYDQCVQGKSPNNPNDKVGAPQEDYTD